MKIEATGGENGSTGGTDALGQGSVVGGSGALCCGTAPVLLEADLDPTFAR